MRAPAFPPASYRRNRAQDVARLERMEGVCTANCSKVRIGQQAAVMPFVKFVNVSQLPTIMLPPFVPAAELFSHLRTDLPCQPRGVHCSRAHF